MKIQQSTTATAQQQQPPARPPGAQISRRCAVALSQQAIEQVTAQRGAEAPTQMQQPQVAQSAPLNLDLNRRSFIGNSNLTLAELILVFALSIGMVTGVQFIWQVATDILLRLAPGEISSLN